MTSQAFLFGLYYYILSLVRKKNETKVIRVTEPTKPFSTETPQMKEMTIRAYDESKLTEAMNQLIFSFLFMMFLHWKFEFVHPLLLQSIIPLKTAFFAPMVQLHIMGKPATGDLERPFKPPVNPFTDLFNQEDKKEESSASDSAAKIIPSKRGADEKHED